MSTRCYPSTYPFWESGKEATPLEPLVDDGKAPLGVHIVQDNPNVSQRQVNW
jgi:hypothetical protein